jgi:hypothetical protein
VLLSKWFQMSQSLAEECEEVGEARPPCRVPGISEFQWFYEGIFFTVASLEQGGRRSWVCGLRKIVPWWRSLGSYLGLQRAMWSSVGDDGVTRRLAFGSSPRWWWWWWCIVVLCAFVCVVCTLRRVMYQCLFFSYDMTLLLP